MVKIKEARFSAQAADGYIRLKTWGELDVKNLDAPANAALALGKEKGITKLLDDIREIDSSNVSISIQAKAMGILWKLKEFNKVAIVFKTREVGLLFFNSLEAVHLSSKFRGFDNEAEAISWLTEH